ncbi:orotidine 5'-phosphate decarboxylase [Cadophora gregata]|uniref:orotidine 5'-phosphate decarboxylase n=1 Tax=Cadophora gregata TaxID=51156 RepID=UPI0026DBE27D|nr:orotidine 5'-phosphate decarboxylase [Cadophora gregata]KAK0125313.1 orotidine 5'-phosphate decarboxylase [Cadophora gregata f. sp. sojae]KAK0128704.1 orotidine 5'-phosphate decarboxylase [Cadophora gregata]
MAPVTTHPITKASYSERAESAIHPLSSYLLRLMTLKQSNLCLSADVSTTNQLLNLADAIGPHIVVLKTHYDLISNWDYNPTTGTGARLARIARRRGFLIFEDRKFGDIGNTVQLQYTEGTAKIIEWSHITNVNMIPGKAAVDALADAAVRWRERKRYEVKTDITVGTPRPESLDSDDEDTTMTPVPEDRSLSAANAGRKASIVSITTVSQHFEPANSPRSYEGFGEEYENFPGIDEAPMERGLLILAQMSSKGNFMTKEYTDACVESAREHKDFVMGFISQESLNTQAEDQFLSMTPGCQLPPEGEDEDAEVNGDGKGQQYNTPQKIIGLMGNDIVIVGRGIIKAGDPVKEAIRYRKRAWEAYQERIGA